MTPQKPISTSARPQFQPQVRWERRTVELGDQISKMQHLNHREMTRVLLKKLFLLVFCQARK